MWILSKANINAMFLHLSVVVPLHEHIQKLCNEMMICTLIVIKTSSVASPMNINHHRFQSFRLNQARFSDLGSKRDRSNHLVCLYQLPQKHANISNELLGAYLRSEDIKIEAIFVTIPVPPSVLRTGRGVDTVTEEG